MALLGVVTLLGWKGKPGTGIRFYSSRINQRTAGAITGRGSWQFLRDPSVLAIIAQGILSLLILAGCLVINLSPVKGSQADQKERVFSVLFVSIFGVLSTVCFINIPVTALRVWKKIRTIKQGIAELEATINSNLYSDFHSED
ncbi:hypothetical protein BRADI_3g35972v3 [Brachypodium distachyon]|uniref:Uncharacterized protein n=1 Tax=Brachypodium distachyon TaxID=15368 RepID=A0A2K2D1D8_BRADI|nr:hypothetical protein BRADI_3g35972v3 [Brachypodium distachyon]